MPLPGSSRLTDASTSDVGVDLQQQLVVLWQPARDNDLLDWYAVSFEVIDDHARPIGGGLEQRPVDFLRPGRQRQAEQHASQIDIDQDRTIAIPPVQGQQAALSRL